MKIIIVFVSMLVITTSVFAAEECVLDASKEFVTCTETRPVSRRLVLLELREKRDYLVAERTGLLAEKQKLLDLIDAQNTRIANLNTDIAALNVEIQALRDLGAVERSEPIQGLGK